MEVGDLINIKFKFCIKYPAYLLDTYITWGSLSPKTNALITVKKGQKAQFIVMAKEDEELVLLVNNTFLIKVNLVHINIIEDNPVPSLDEPYKSRLEQPISNKEFEVIKKSLNLTLGNKPALEVLLYKITRLQNGVETE